MAFTTTALTGGSYELSSAGSLTVGTCELGGFKSGTFTIEGESVENYARGDGGWTKAAPGKRSGSVSLTFLKLQSDAAQAGIRGLMLDSDYQTKGVEIVYKTTSSTAGPGFKGTFCLTNYSESSTEGGEAVECSAEFAAFGPITVDNASSTGSGS